MPANSQRPSQARPTGVAAWGGAAYTLGRSVWGARCGAERGALRCPSGEVTPVNADTSWRAIAANAPRLPIRRATAPARDLIWRLILACGTTLITPRIGSAATPLGNQPNSHSSEAGTRPAHSPLGLPEDPTAISADDDDHWWNGFGSFSERGLSLPAYALTLYHGELVAGGEFVRAGGQPALTSLVARWDGANWYPLGAGLASRPEIGERSWVEDVIEWRGDLVATGRFFYCNGFPGGTLTNHIARWDGTRWYPLGSGLAQEPE